MDMSLVYIVAVVLIVAIGFVFALRMGITASIGADREWPAILQENAQEATQEATQETQLESSAVPAASTH